MSHEDPWRKPSAELVERFHQAVAAVDGIQVRKMFGFPAAFINGNMAAGLHRDTFIVRLPDDERQARLDDGWSLFEPMPGRPMREYLALPADVAADAERARVWIERAAAYAGTLPPKEAKPRRRR
ncbi:MAG TPA: TfoX/Sxy family protein [Candidatus Limnocylindria bacterium]|nr:TfoX/Sxy family protein [Candidatus Limnocylindria bacterium]